MPTDSMCAVSQKTNSSWQYKTNNKITYVMNKKSKIIIFLSLVLTMSLTSCFGRLMRALEIEEEVGVEINGVVWATRNTSSPNLFDRAPERAGAFYQWNRTQSWLTSGTMGIPASDWNRTLAAGTEWSIANDPCRQGWRLPTYEEFGLLIEAGSEWTTYNGVDGRLFGTYPNQIFLPAVGMRSGGDGALRDRGTFGVYWSSTSHESEYAMHLSFNSDNVSRTAYWRSGGLSVRCVADVNAPSAAVRARLRAEQEAATRPVVAPPPRPGVIIDGVRWATTNLSASGTFARNPEDAGMLFQWGRPQGWAETGNVTGWDSSETRGSSWIDVNDPCPQGWRIPTREEQESLIRAGNTWTTRNGVGGRLFGTAPYQIFLPATNSRSPDGTLNNNRNRVGNYWNRSGVSNSLNFSENRSGITIGARGNYGFNIRCVGID